MEASVNIIIEKTRTEDRSEFIEIQMDIEVGVVVDVLRLFGAGSSDV